MPDEQGRKVEKNELNLDLLQKIKEYSVCIAAGGSHVAALKADGTVVTMGYDKKTVSYHYTDDERPNKIPKTIKKEITVGQCNTSGWRDIVAVAAGFEHTVGLKANGTVVAVGSNTKGQCKVGGWRSIVAVSAGHSHTVGLKADGAVVAAGDNSFGGCDTGGWRDIVAVSAGSNYTTGLRADGTVVSTDEDYKISQWRNIIAVWALYAMVGLKSDGTVLVTDKYTPVWKIDDWHDIVFVSGGYRHVTGLKTDSTIETAGENGENQCNTGEWTDIAAVSVYGNHTIGLKTNGTVVATGNTFLNQCDVSELSGIGPAANRTRKK